MTRPGFTTTLASAALVALALVVVLATKAPAAAQAPIPRVCWWSDYANAKLSNRCVWDKRDGGRWLMAVDGTFVDARAQRLPVANLCHYFHGTDCP